MNYLKDAGRWGSSMIGEGNIASATSFASSTLKSGSDLVSKGAKKASNLASIPSVAAKHSFDDPRGGTHVVTEVCHLAEGAFGSVTKVRDVSGKEYAVKRIGCQEGVQIASSLKAAEMEATILKTLPPHGNIIQCYGSITDNHGPGSATVKLLMELCPGGTLLDYMDSKDGKLGAKEVIGPFGQICSAVAHLHAQKPPIQHRDLKVENVLMGADNRWKLCDFGSCSTEVVPAKELSRQRFLELQEEIDKTVTMLYRPPEMADIELNYRIGYTIDTQVDIWMLGCILYTLTFYRHPFQDCPNGGGANGKYFIPYEHPLGKSQKLCGLIHWLLAKDPQDRPTAPRMGQLLGDIGKVQYPDLLTQMPQAVRDKITKLDALFTKRKDTGDIPIPAAAAALLAASGSSAASGRSSATASSPAKTAPQQRPSSGSTKASPQPVSNAPRSTDTDSFDLMSALAPSGAPAKVGVAQNGSATAASPPQDLFSFSPKQTAAAPPVIGGGAELGDLLGFGEPAPAAAPSPAANADFANFGAPAAPAAPASADWCDFASFSSAPAPVQSGGYTTPSASNDLIGFDFADPMAPSPALTNPTAQSCGGAHRAAAPAPAANVNLLDLM